MVTTTGRMPERDSLNSGGIRVQAVFFKLLLPCLLLMLLVGCAQPNKVLRYDPFAGEQREEWPVWPRAPEVPRYIYAGQLTGEQNFLTEEGEAGEVAGNVLAWLIGIGQEEPLPTVLQRPQSGMVDGEGRIYVTDVSRQAVFVFDKVAGQLNVWGLASEGERFIAPIGIVEGRDGLILVTDAELGYVVVLDADGKPQGSIGESLLQRPTGIVRDPEPGLIYVADTRANDIKVFNDAGELINTIGYEGDRQGALNAPTYVALSDGELFVTDTLNSRIQVFDTEGNYLRQFGKRGLYVGELSRPKGVAVDSERHVYVIESYYDYLLIYDEEGRFLLPIGGAGQGIGQFYLPAGVWVDGQDRVYVADMFNGRVVIFQPFGETE